MNNTPQKKPKSERSHYIHILLIVLISILFYVLISNIGTVVSVFKVVFSVLSPLILGFAIAFILNLPLRFLEFRVFGKLTKKNGKVWSKIKRPLCIVLSILIIVSIIALLFYYIIPEFISRVRNFIAELPQLIESLDYTIQNIASALHLPVNDWLDLDWWETISNLALSFLNQNGGGIAAGAIDFAVGLFSSIVNFILAVVFALYVLASKESLGRLAKSIVYSLMKREHARKLLSVVILSNKAFSGFISGQCIEALLISVLCYLGMLIFKMPYPLMVSCIIGVFAFVPIFGAIAGAAIGAFLILLDSPIKAVWFVIFIIVLQQIESNLIYPKIMGKQVGLPGLWVLAAVTVGGGLFGVLGILLSVPIASVLYTLLHIWIEKRLTERNICHKSMSHDTSEPKHLIEEISEEELSIYIDTDGKGVSTAKEETGLDAFMRKIRKKAKRKKNKTSANDAIDEQVTIDDFDYLNDIEEFKPTNSSKKEEK